MALHYSALQLQLQNTTLQLQHCTTHTHHTRLHYTILHSSTQHDSTLHYSTRHYTTWQLQLRYATLQLQLNYTNYTIYTTTTTPLQYNYNYNCATPHYIQQLWVRWPLQPFQPLQKTQCQPPFGSFRSISGFALPSVIHNNQPLL